MTRQDGDSGLASWIEETVEKTATSIEGIHKSIAEVPLEVMRTSGVLEQVADDVSDVQGRSIGAVYDVVRDLNHRVAGLVSELLGPRDETSH